MFSIYKVTEHWVLAYFAEKEKRRKFAIFDQKACTNSFRKMQIFDFSKWMFLYSKMAGFLYKRLQKTFFWPFLLKKKKGQSFLFLTKNHARTPLKNAKFLTFLTPCWYSLKLVVFYLHVYKTASFGLYFFFEEEKRTEFPKFD